MTDRPIIFSGAMVRALLAGRKTQTRRLVKVPGIMGGRYPILPPEEAIELEPGEFAKGVFHYSSTGALSGPYRLPACVGDRLWVRESGILHPGVPGGSGDLFRHDVPATSETGIYWSRNNGGPGASYSVAGCSRQSALAGVRAKVRPSIHMPRWASRVTLIVEGVKVERLQDISEADAIAEGAKAVPIGAPPGIPDLVGYHHGQAIEPPEDCFISATASFRHLWRSLHGDESWDENPFVVALTFRVERGNIDQIGSLVRGGAPDGTRGSNAHVGSAAQSNEGVRSALTDPVPPIREAPRSAPETRELPVRGAAA